MTDILKLKKINFRKKILFLSLLLFKNLGTSFHFSKFFVNHFLIRAAFKKINFFLIFSTSVLNFRNSIFASFFLIIEGKSGITNNNL